MSTTLSEANEKIEAHLNEIENNNPIGDIERLTGLKSGTEEHKETSELLNKVKNTNSTKRVNRTLKSLEVVGFIGIVLSVFIKFAGIVYDIDYHVPFLKKVIGEYGVGLLGVFVTGVILLLTHAMSDGLVNNKWRKTPRSILGFLLLLGIIASGYFDYRAVGNYTKSVVDVQKSEKLVSNIDVSGVAMQNQDNKEAIIKQNINSYVSSLNSNRDMLKSLMEQKQTVNISIERVKAKKENTKSNREIRKLNQNIYTSRKQLKALNEDIERLENSNDSLSSKIEAEQKKLDTVTAEKQSTIKSVNSQMDSEQFRRLFFLFAIIIFIEIASFGKTLSDHLGNKNTNDELYEHMDSLNNNYNAFMVLKQALQNQEARQTRDMNRELRMRGVLSDVHSLSSISTMKNQAENIKSITLATNQIGEATNEVVEQAVEGIANGIKANLYEQKAKKFLEALEAK